MIPSALDTYMLKALDTYMYILKVMDAELLLVLEFECSLIPWYKKQLCIGKRVCLDTHNSVLEPLETKVMMAVVYS